MPLVNTVASHHNGPVPVAGFQWLPFKQADLHILNHAIHTITARITGSHTCNAAFRALPRGRSFADIWADRNIWISYDPNPQADRYGATLGNDVTITAFSLRIGFWTVAATLIHELAHVDGAPGGNNHAAEATLRQCLLRNLENPNIMGMFNPAGCTKLA